jgi:YegS/Rv2252/BmrU family lipid kinase
MKPVKILFFVNPNSGADSKANPPDIIKDVLQHKQIAFHIHELEKDTDSKTIVNLLKKYKPEIAVAAGGDGTVNMVAASLIGFQIPLGILPLGSANGLAFELGIPQKIEDAIENLFTGKSQPLDAVRINNGHISLHLSDFGMNARVIKGFEKEGKRGFMGYFKHFIRELRTPKSFRCIIETPVKTYIHRALMVVIANSGSYRSGAVINPTHKKDDGRFEIIVLKPRRHWVIRNTIAAFTGNFHNQPNIATYECTSAKIMVRPSQELQVDGELLGKLQSVNAEIIKHALHVIVP